MRTAFPGLAAMKAPLRALLETCFRNMSRTKRVATRSDITDEEWTKDRKPAWDTVKALVEDTVPLGYPVGADISEWK